MRSAAEWRLAWRALRAVVIVRLALQWMPYASIRARSARRREARKRTEFRGDARHRDLARDPAALAWAVRAAARYVPRATCLTQALTLEALLADVGLTADVRIGVARASDGSFEAHAWVVGDHEVLIGGRRDLARFALLSPHSSDLLRR